MRATKITRRPWGSAELEVLRSMYPDCHTQDVAAWLGRSVKSVYEAAKMNGVRKSPEYLSSDAAARIRRGRQHPACIASRIKPGSAPWNKGLHGVNGESSTRFRPGQMPQTWKPIGSVRIERDGPKVKVSDTRDKARDWRYAHHLVWEKANGPIPAGMLVVFKPGMRTNDVDRITADMLDCIDRRELMLRNSYHTTLPPELARLVQLRGALHRQINKHSRTLEHQA